MISAAPRYTPRPEDPTMSSGHIPHGATIPAPTTTEVSPGIWEWKLKEAQTIPQGKLTISIRDKQGNTTKIERTFQAK